MVKWSTFECLQLWLFITVFGSLIYHLISSLTLRIFCLISYLIPTSFNYILLFIFIPSWSVPKNWFSLLISVWPSYVCLILLSSSFNLCFQAWPFVTGFQTPISDNILLTLRYSPQNSENKVHDNNLENH